ncbi:hypothetical protein Nepgr_007755 [Nepenthes gracilis]|uniref:Uncharacterized protein n=1 Tax=Nepenthes gracilis TaxID=150966 RepID=A0AAD3S7K5_NEPGR|nr:hypothetical protein Nepgr_007755 [Nepenthes gracilis]
MSDPLYAHPEFQSAGSTQNMSCYHFPSVPPQSIDNLSDNPSPFNPNVFPPLPAARASPLLGYLSSLRPSTLSENCPSIESESHVCLLVDSSLRVKSDTPNDSHTNGASQVPVANPSRRQDVSLTASVLSSHDEVKAEAKLKIGESSSSIFPLDPRNIISKTEEKAFPKTAGPGSLTSLNVNSEVTPLVTSSSIPDPDKLKLKPTKTMIEFPYPTPPLDASRSATDGSEGRSSNLRIQTKNCA